MPSKKNESIEQAAPAQAAAAAAPIAAPAPAPAPARRGLPGLAIAGIVVGGVVAVGLLFGGGVLVGTNLHGGPRFGTSHHAFQGGPDGFGGPGPVRPGQGNPDRPDTRDQQGGSTGGN